MLYFKLNLINIAGLPLLPIFFLKWQASAALLQQGYIAFLVFSTLSNILLIPLYLILLRRVEVAIISKNTYLSNTQPTLNRTAQAALTLVVLGSLLITDLTLLL
jgi:hypothetical protein